MTNKHTLPINTETFGFVQRELINGKKLTNQCGRDFLYYCLNYYVPEKHNRDYGNPKDIREKRILGYTVPVWLVWTNASFLKAPKYFKSLGLIINLNGVTIKNSFQFVLAMYFSFFRFISFKKGIKEIQSAIDSGTAVGLDIAISFGGLLDHVMFVYGYDDENLYVFDTHQVRGLEYEKVTSPEDNRFIMKLPKSIAQKRWTLFSRVWIVSN